MPQKTNKQLSHSYFSDFGDFGLSISTVIADDCPMLKITHHTYGDFYGEINQRINTANQLRKLGASLIEAAGKLEEWLKSRK